MIEVSMFIGEPCPNCGHAKLNVIKELGLSNMNVKTVKM